MSTDVVPGGREIMLRYAWIRFLVDGVNVTFKIDWHQNYLSQLVQKR